MRKRIVNGKIAPEYAENPFLKHTAEMSKIGNKPTYLKGPKGLSILTEDGTVHAASIMFQEEVEANGYIKVYAEGISAILGLKSCGMAVFMLIYKRLYGKQGIDKTEIVLNYKMLSATTKKEISERTFSRGINDCLRVGLIAQSVVSGFYFVNPAFIYNGNRLNIVKQYINKEAEKAKEAAKEKAIPEEDIYSIEE